MFSGYPSSGDQDGPTRHMAHAADPDLTTHRAYGLPGMPLTPEIGQMVDTAALASALASNRLAGAALADAQQKLLLRLIETYTGRTRPDHAAVKLAEAKRHLSETYFAWMGGYGDDDVFYYRVHSPVILIEFNHESGIAFDNEQPTRKHIHTVVRTPNGNDYGKDLLRQHHERFHGARPVAH